MSNSVALMQGERETGADVRSQNVTAAMAIANIVKTSLGPINELHLLTAKPALYLVNMSEKDFIRKKNKWLPKLKAWFDENRWRGARVTHE